MAKTELLHIRISSDQKQYLQDRSGDEGVSAYVQNLIDRDMKPYDPADLVNVPVLYYLSFVTADNLLKPNTLCFLTPEDRNIYQLNHNLYNEHTWEVRIDG